MKDQALDLFAPLGPTYDRYASLLSFGQDPRWRRFLVSRMDVGPDDRVLDVATGTAAVAIELVRRSGCRVVGLDQSGEMLAEGRRRVEAAGLGDRIELVQGEAERLPFDDASFDGLTFTYLLRYVDDPLATLGSWHGSSGREGRSRCSSSASREASPGRRGSSGCGSACRPPAR